MNRVKKISGIIIFTLLFMIGLFQLGVKAQDFLFSYDNRVGTEIVNEIVEEELPKEGVDNNQPPLEVIKHDEDNDTIGEVEESTEIKEDIKEVDGSKIVFLTFDDGPTKLTPLILDILRDNEVKATFFTLGKLLDRNPDIAKATQMEGHMILPHSYSHDYSIYSTLESFYDDLHKVEEAFERVLGLSPPPILRFIGGSSNHSSFEYGGQSYMNILTKDIKDRGYYYLDWNIDSGDSRLEVNEEIIKNNVINSSIGKDVIVVLFHDTERNTPMANILPDIIQYYKDEGYIFKILANISKDELDLMIELRLINREINR